MSGNKVFFEHINGLRGLAIILVLLFHLLPDVFPCCFYGVDVFLVITGYLLFLGLRNQDGSLLSCGRFAMKRAGRILPPVAILIALTLAAGFFLLDYQDVYEASRFGRYIMSGTGNIYLNRIAADYFATDFSGNPLMHMWYIGVTLQVYLLFIVGNAVCKRLPRRVWLPMLFVIALASLAWRYCLSIDWVKDLVGNKVAEPSYYETLPRVWEVMAGGLVLLLPEVNSKWKGNLLTIVGLLAIVLPVMDLYKGGAAMFPVVVLGTVLIIRYMPAGSLSCLLCNRPLMFVGTISFSLYLVHLPIFVCYKSCLFRTVTWTDNVMMLALSFLIGWGFYLLVERWKWGWKIWVPVYVCAYLGCCFVKSTHGLQDFFETDEERLLLPEYTQWSKEESADIFRDYDMTALNVQTGLYTIMEASKPKEEIAMLRIGDQHQKPSFVLVGDSHAQAFYAGFDTVCSNAGETRSGVFLSTIISPFWNIEIPPLSLGSAYYCNRAKMEAFLHWLEKHPELKTVVVSQYWRERMISNKYDWDKKHADCSVAGHTEALREFCKRVKLIGKNVVLMAPPPDFEFHPARSARLVKKHNASTDAYKIFECSHERYTKRHGHVVRMLKQMESEGLASVLEPASVVSAGAPHLSYENGKLYFRDKDHLSVTGSIMYMTKLKERFFELISE